MFNILIYEEDDLMRALLKEWLSDAGYGVSAISPGQAALGGKTDLVLASLSMPKQGGAQLVRAIRAAHPGAPVIALSAQFRSGLSAAGSTAQALGVQQVIAKPLSRAELLTAVCATLSRARSATGC